MPELPEIEGLARWLERLLRGKIVVDIRLRSVAVLKTFDPPISSLAGKAVEDSGRRGKYLWIRTEGGIYLVLHLSLGGWVRWNEGEVSRKPTQRGPIAVEIRFEDGMLDITEHGKEKRLALWLVRDLDDVARVAELGPDALDPNLTEESFAALIRGRPGTVKKALADQDVIAGIGNAYSDEILHVARVSPFARTATLGDAQLRKVFVAMREVVSEAAARAAEMSAKELKDDKRSHMRVHGRAGQPCPVCGDTVRAVWTGGRSFQYCPTCQTGGRVYADRRLSRLLK